MVIERSRSIQSNQPHYYWALGGLPPPPRASPRRVPRHVRGGFLSHRWSDSLETGSIPRSIQKLVALWDLVRFLLPPPLTEGRKRPRPVGDPALLLKGEFSEGSPVNLEDGVIAESFPATRGTGDNPHRSTHGRSGYPSRRRRRWRSRRRHPSPLSLRGGEGCHGTRWYRGHKRRTARENSLRAFTENAVSSTIRGRSR